MSQMLPMLLALPFPALVIVAAFKDVTSYTIPNWIPLALIASFVPAALAAGVSPAGLGLHLAIGVAGLVVGMAMFAANWIGGGDAKLLAAAALWLGWPACLPFLLVTAVAGGGLAMMLLALRSVWLRPYAIHGPDWMVRLTEPGEAVPYGVAIAVGALATFPLSAFA